METKVASRELVYYENEYGESRKLESELVSRLSPLLDFEFEDCQRFAEFVSLVLHLPKPNVQPLTEATITAYAKANDLDPKQLRLAGVYDRYDHTIYLAPKHLRHQRTFTESFLHELAHHVQLELHSLLPLCSYHSTSKQHRKDFLEAQKIVYSIYAMTVQQATGTVNPR